MSDDLDLEEKLSNIHSQLKKKGISLLETEKLFKEAQQAFKGGSKTKAVEFEELNIALDTVHIVFKFADDWKAGKVNPPTDEELNFLEMIIELMPDILDKLAKNSPLINKDNNFFVEANQNRKKLKKLIQQEKSDRKQQSQPNTINQRQTDSQQPKKELN